MSGSPMDKPVKCKDGTDQPRPDNPRCHRPKSSCERRPPAAETRQTRIAPFQIAPSLPKRFSLARRVRGFQHRAPPIRQPGVYYVAALLMEGNVFLPLTKAMAFHRADQDQSYDKKGAFAGRQFFM